MNEQMEFPKTWEEYEQEYGFNDSEEVYTNNSRLIQSFRVKQWLDHLEQEPCDDAINREDTLKAMIEQLGIKNEDYLIPAEATLYKVVKNMPPVTPQPKHEDVAKAFQFGLAFGFGEKYDEMDKVIDEIKKVCTSQSKTGHWIDEGIYADGQNYHTFRCSECEWHYIGNESELADFKYCPFCRAKMQEVEE